MHKKTIFLILTISLLIIAGSLFIFTRHAAAPRQNGSSDAQTSDTKNPAPAAPFDKTQYSLTDPTSIWVVVNKQHPLNPKSYAPSDLQNVGSGQYMRAEAAQ